MAFGGVLRQIEVAAGARHPVRALLEEAVGAVAMTEIEVLPRGTAGGSTTLDALAIDQNFNRAYVAGEVARIGVGSG